MDLILTLNEQISQFDNLNHDKLTKNLNEHTIIEIKKLMSQERNYLMFCNSVVEMGLKRIDSITNKKLQKEFLIIYRWIQKEIKLCTELILYAKPNYAPLITEREKHLEFLHNLFRNIEINEEKSLAGSQYKELFRDVLRERKANYILSKLGLFILFVIDFEKLIMKRKNVA